MLSAYNNNLKVYAFNNNIISKDKGFYKCNFGHDVFLKYGNRKEGGFKIAHFAHYINQGTCNHKSESLEHQRIKKLLYDYFCLQIGIVKKVDVEYFIKLNDGSYVEADVYLELENGIKIAIEYQKSYVSSSSIVEKHKKYKENNIICIYFYSLSMKCLYNYPFIRLLDNLDMFYWYIPELEEYKGEYGIDINDIITYIYFIGLDVKTKKELLTGLRLEKIKKQLNENICLIKKQEHSLELIEKRKQNKELEKSRGKLKYKIGRQLVGYTFGRNRYPCYYLYSGIEADIHIIGYVINSGYICYKDTNNILRSISPEGYIQIITDEIIKYLTDTELFNYFGF